MVRKSDDGRSRLILQMKMAQTQKVPGYLTDLVPFAAVLWLLAAFILCPPPILAADSGASSDPAAAVKEALSRNARGDTFPQSASDRDSKNLKTLVLKVMVVNPSKIHKQIYPMKAYLPPEIHPEHIQKKDDLEIGFDSQKGAYYLAKDVELDAGASVVKTIEVEDIWQIPELSLTSLSKEAAELMGKLELTPYEDRARLLVQNTEVLLTQIFESQQDTSLTPEQHIQAYHENKQKVKEIELDLVALRRLVSDASGDAGIKGSAGKSGSVGFLGAGLQKDLVSRNTKGSIPAWIAWRIIFVILGFMGIATGIFYGIWISQMRKLERAKNKVPQRPKAKVGTDSIFKDVLGKDAHGGADPKAKK